MKISTSLIRIRYAVGVMLALSAVFAVVIGTSTLQPRDATAQDPKPTLSIASDPADIAETAASISFTLTSTAAVTTATDVEVSVSGDASLTLPSSRIVTFAAAGTTAPGIVTFTNGNTASGKREVTISLPASHPDFTISTDAKSAMVTIHDDENSAATGAPGIRVVQDAGTEDDDDANVRSVTAAGSTTYSLGTSAVSGGQVSSGDVLVADLRSIADADGLVSAKGYDGTTDPVTMGDGILGAVLSNGRVATSDAGAPSTPDDNDVTYQWTRINGMDDDTLEDQGDDPADVDLATTTSYTVVAADIGAKIKVEVTIQDDAHATVGKGATVTDDDNDNNDPEMLQSGTVGVPATLSIGLPEDGADVAEDSATFSFTVSSDGAVSEALPVRIAVSGPSHLDLPSYEEVTIPVGTAAGDPITGTVAFSNRAGTQGKQTVTLSLPSSVSGYRISADMNTATVTIHDDENTDATGAPGILVVQKPGVDGDDDDTIPDNIQIQDNGDEDDTYSLGTSAVSGGQVSSGDVLVADLKSIMDADGLVSAKGYDGTTDPVTMGDGILGAVLSNGRVATSDAGAPSTPDDNDVTYQWTRINGMDDDTLEDQGDDPADVDLATTTSYTVVAADIGAKIKVEVTIQDDAHATVDKTADDAEMLASGSVNVPATLSISATATDVAESAATLSFTVTSDGPVDADLLVRVSVSGASHLNLPASASVTIEEDDDSSADTATGTNEGVVIFTNATGAQGKQTVTLSLPSSVSGYRISADMNTATVTIHDDENTDATGAPGIRVVQDAGTEDDDDANVRSVTAAGSTTYSLGTSAVSGGQVSSGDVLVADLRSIADADGLVSAKGYDGTTDPVTMGDGILGAVLSNGRVATSDAGAPSTPDDNDVTYQWTRINGMDDDTLEDQGDDPADVDLATTTSYTVVAADIGAKIKVEVTIQDDAHVTTSKAAEDAEVVTSGSVNVLSTLSIMATEDVAEDAGTLSFTVTSDAAVTAADGLKVSVSVSGPSDLDLESTVDVTIANEATASTGGTVRFTDVEGVQGPRVVTLRLPSSVTGYLISGDMNEAKVTIHDDENSDLVGMPTILRLGAAEQTAGKESTVTTDDEYARPAEAITNPDDVVPVGARLVADLRSLADADELDNAEGTDMMLGVVDDSGMVSLGDAGAFTTLALAEAATSIPDPDTDNDNVTYQWTRIVGMDDDDPDNTDTVKTDDVDIAEADGGTDPTYTVDTADFGAKIKVKVTIRDDAYAYAGMTDHTEMADSSNAVEVKESVSFGKAEYVVKEGESVNVQVTLSNLLPSTATAVSLTTDPETGALVDSVEDSVPFAATDISVTFPYTAPTDGPGTRSFVISIAVDGDGNVLDGDGDALTDYVVGEHGSTTIRITDETDSPASSGTTLTIDNLSPSAGQTITAMLKGLEDPDGLNDPHEVCFVWIIGGVEQPEDCTMAKSQSPLGATSQYTVSSADVGKSISVRFTYTDNAGNANTVSLTGEPTAAVARLVTDRPDGTAKISRIEPTIRGITVSAGDRVRLSVDVYGLQNVKDSKLAEKVTFEWSVDPVRGTLPTSEEGNSTVMFTAPSSPAEYTVTAKLGASDCYDAAAKVGEKTAGCDAEFKVRVRRPPAPQPEDPAPVNPPGDIPELIPDADGNQYEVFTPVEGGMFDGGEGYSIKAAPGAVPNGEFIGVRMSDDGAASNVGQIHQRYTLGGNMYGVHAVDASGAAISSYVLEDPATVCVPLPASVRANLSTLSLAAINSDGSLTILAAQAKLNTAGDTMVCGNLSNLPSSVAVGTRGAPDAIPTATPVPVEVLPDTGGASPASGGLVWVLLLGAAAVVSGTFIVAGRRRKMVRSK